MLSIVGTLVGPRVALPVGRPVFSLVGSTVGLSDPFEGILLEGSLEGPPVGGGGRSVTTAVGVLVGSDGVGLLVGNEDGNSPDGGTDS